MKIDRLIGIITILLQQDKVTAPELSRRFEVSRRTINRDIEDICRAGIPLVTTQGYGGGISIAEGYKIDKSLFTRDELQTVFAGLKGMDSVSETPALAQILDKLSGKENHIVADSVVMIDLASHYQSDLTGKIASIKKAVLEHHFITFRYYYQKGQQQRTIEPYHLIFRWSSWYVFGYCPMREDFRLFKLNRLWNLEMSEETFTPREIPEEDLEFDDYFSGNRIHLKAVFAKEEKHRLIEEYGIDCYREDEEGNLLFEWDFASYENMREWVFSFGDKVHILEPDSLREDRRRQAVNILQMTESDENLFF